MEITRKIKRKWLKRFYRNESGNFATLGSAAMFVLAAMAGLTVDNMNLTQAQAELQSLTDAGVIAASSDTTFTLAERQKIFQETIDIHAAQNVTLRDIEFDLTTNTRNPESVSVSVFATAQVPLLFSGFFGKNSDVSATSGGQADNRTIEVSLALDISTSMFDARLDEMQIAAKAFIEDLLDGENAQRSNVAMVPFGGTVRLPQEMDQFLIPPAISDEVYWPGGVWNGCLFMRPEQYENGIDPLDKFTYLPSFYSFNARGENEMNPWCPRAGNEVVGLTQDKDILFDTIDNFTRSDGTGTGMAMAWAYNTLRPGYRGIFPNSRAVLPYRFRKHRRKIIVLMSDGGSSSLVFPNASHFSTDIPFEVKPNDGLVEKVGRQVEAFERICDEVKSRDIEVFTVGFEVSQPEHIEALRYCATDETYFYQAGLGDLAVTFEEIAGQVSAVRISQ